MRLALDLSPIDIDAAQINAYIKIQSRDKELVPDISKYCFFCMSHPKCGFMDFLHSINVPIDKAKELTRQYDHIVKEGISYVDFICDLELLRQQSESYEISLILNLKALRYVWLSDVDVKPIMEHVYDLINTYKGIFTISENITGKIDLYQSAIDCRFDRFIFDQHYRLNDVSGYKSATNLLIYRRGKFDVLFNRPVNVRSIYSLGDFFQQAQQAME
jgi:hypothetical protein